MSGSLRISLKSGERIFINGAVLRVDRRVSIEMLNSVTFLLEHHVMKPEDARTPLRQLYFMVQTALIDPSGSAQPIAMANESLARLKTVFENSDVLKGLGVLEELFGRQRYFESLKVIRNLIPIEDGILGTLSKVEDGAVRAAACS